jgi:hypothetical protein
MHAGEHQFSLFFPVVNESCNVLACNIKSNNLPYPPYTIHYVVCVYVCRCVCVCVCLQEIIEFLFFPVVNEGCRVVAEGIVDKAADLDVATVMAMGFPPYR